MGVRIKSMSMKKILFVNDLVSGGGVEKVMSDLVNYLPENEYDVTIGTMIENTNYKTMYKKHIKYINIVSPWYKKISGKTILTRIVNKVYREIKILNQLRSINNKFDVVISFKEGDCMKFVSRLKKPKKLAWIHVDYSVFHWTKGIFKNSRSKETKCMKKFDKIICVSNGVKQGLKNTLGYDDNVYVRYNPINNTKILESSKEAVLDITKEKDRLLFVTVGRLDPQKGYDRLLNICNELRDENMKYELWIIGSGDEKEKLNKFILENHLNNVKLIGEKSNPYKYMKLADWIICSSRFEGFSTVLQEATILGVPIITTDCSGSKELLGESEYGIVVENNSSDLKRGMKLILSNEEITVKYRERVIKRKSFVDLEARMRKIQEFL